VKYIITGGAGFVGTKLTERLAGNGHTVFVFDVHAVSTKGFDPDAASRVRSIEIDLIKNSPDISACEDTDVIIHLAGVTIFKRWTEAYKKLILDSRIATLKNLLKSIDKCSKKPEVCVSASANGYYGEGGESIMNESSPGGDDFLAGVCAEWESVLSEARAMGMRTVSVRTSVVLGAGGFLSILIPMYRLYLGGRLGSGMQWFSWVHVEDLISLYEYLSLKKDISGPVNAVAPENIRNKDFTQVLAKVLNRKAPWIIPGFLIKIILGEFGDSALSSQRVESIVLNKTDFSFKYPDIKSALKSIV
jgi:uncharacterized protein (TIGR01777 family)